MVGQTTGGTPASTGVYYDDGYSRGLMPLGTSYSDCSNGAVPVGAEVQYAENIEPTVNIVPGDSKTASIMLDASQFTNKNIPYISRQS